MNIEEQIREAIDDRTKPMMGCLVILAKRMLTAPGGPVSVIRTCDDYTDKTTEVFLCRDRDDAEALVGILEASDRQREFWNGDITHTIDTQCWPQKRPKLFLDFCD